MARLINTDGDNMKPLLLALTLTLALLAASCNKNPKADSKPDSKKDSLIIVKVDSSNQIRFSGITWTATGEDKESSPYDFSVYSTDNIFTDSLGRLHMIIQKKGDVWYGAELTADSSMGYGEYAFYVDSRLDNLDRNVCLNFAVENSNPPEMVRGVSQLGIQVCYWGDDASKNALQYVMYTTSKKISEVHTPNENFAQSEDKSVHRIVVNPDMVYFGSTNNSGSKIFDQLRVTKKDKATRNSDVDEITYAKPSAKNRFSMSLGLPEANETQGGKPVEIIISKVVFIPSAPMLAKSK